MTDVTPVKCVWCSSDQDVAEFRNEPRCGRCRAAEQAISEAREFVGFYGLRPLGGSVESDDDEEREHRVAAREASAELTRIRTHRPPRRTSRSGQRAPAARPASTAAKAEAKAAAGKTQTARSGAARPADVSRPDHDELASRAQRLLAQLTDIEERLAVAQKESGLSGKAKVSDLTAKRESVLRTLAALEKAKRALAPA
ncbi:hypothetical protein GIY30_11800 [Gordonia sp. HNM0687]|uniref:Uncharacterized protein n=1 Tax=Gordonia mangrovi TaxID=2665643 RepID=A0A6L7GQ18_9ACTN|nr:hypothetical protein [Gordonia mangrovi]MXP22029.1 hypothetical protein [Gordonia mangrovi]UVF78041.1 hypothetical protein NWF22_22935 [Gordonia mangrovi]